MAVQLTWHVQNCDLIGSLESDIKKINLKFWIIILNILWNGELKASHYHMKVLKF